MTTPTAPTPPSTPPAVPDRSNRAAFPGQMYTFATWQAGSMVTDMTALANNAYGNAVIGADASTTASAAAATATAAAAAAVAVSGATGWVSGTTYSLGQCVWSPLTFQTYRRKVAGSGETDPSLDATNWAVLGTSLATLHATELCF